MKKTISILLIVTMLLSMAVAAMPIGAMTLNNSIGNLGLVGSSANGNVTILNGVGSTAAAGTPGANVTGAPSTGIGAGTVGSEVGGTGVGSTAVGSTVDVDNVTLPNVNPTGAGNITAMSVPAEGKLPVTTWNKPWETESGWIAVDDYLDIANNDGPNQNDKKYYLVADITVPDSKASGNVSTGFIIDGNGHTITFNGGRTFMACADNAIIRNVKLAGSIDGTARDGKDKNMSLSPIGGHNYKSPQSNGKVEFYNVWSDVDIKINGTDRYAGGLIAVVGGGSVFENVVVTGKVETTAESTVKNIGGIVGEATGSVSFKNCLVASEMNVGGGVENVGGIVGKGGDVVVANCSSTGTITAVGSNGANIGGIAGYIANWKDGCKNNVISATISADGVLQSVGGMIGYNNGYAYVNNNVFTGSIVLKKDATFKKNYVISGPNNDGIYTLKDNVLSGIGGLAGVVGSSYMCKNNTVGGMITTNAAVHYVGGIAGYAKPDCGNDNNKISTNITINSGIKAVGGNIGYAFGGSKMSNSTFSGSIVLTKDAYFAPVLSYTNTSNDTTNFETTWTVGKTCNYGVGGFLGTATAAMTFENCVVKTDADEVNGIVINNGAAFGTHEVGIGGVVGHVFDCVLTLKNVMNEAPVYVDHIGHNSLDNGVGGIVGQVFCYSNSTVHDFDNVYNKGAITMTGNSGNIPVGGILGYSYKSYIDFDNCGNYGAISSTAVNYHIGGVYGFSKDVTNTTTFDNCFNKGNITVTAGTPRGNTLYVGGISGNNVENQSFNNCINAGDITINCNYASYVGGILTYKNKAGTIKNCTNEGDIAFTGNYSNGWLGIGGITGLYNVSGVTFEKCVNAGDISYTGTAGNYTLIGGIVGVVNAAVTFDTCKVSGAMTISGKRTTADDGFGGICGWSNKALTFNNCSVDFDITVDGDFLNAGGLVGTVSAAITATNCKYSGDISVSGGSSCAKRVGGFAGSASNTVTLTGCTVSDCTIDATGKLNVVAGFVANAGTVTLADCESLCEIDVDGTASYIGGFVATTGNYFTATNCVFNGDIDIDGSANTVGGIVGNVSNTTKFINSKVEGTITVKSTGTTAADIGGVAGYANALEGGGCSNNLSSVTINASGVLRTVAGMVGYVNKWTAITNSTFNGSIAINTSDVELPEGTQISVGGLEGFVGSNCYLKNNVSEGTIVTNADVNYVGGLVGLLGGSFDSGHNYGNKIGTNITVKAAVNAVGGYAGRTNGSVNITTTTFSGDLAFEGTATFASNGTAREHGIGGLIGTATNTTVLANCKTTNEASILVESGDPEVPAQVKFDHHEVGIGGLIGLTVSYDKDIRVENVLNEASVTVNRTGVASFDDGVGGVVGSAFGNPNAKFIDADNKGTITLADNTANFPVGGVLGYKYKGTATFENCDNGGKIVTPAGNYMVGGIHGYAFSNDGTVPKSSYKNCSFTGEITVNGGTSATKGSKGLQVGGIAGACEDDKSFENCVAAGKITVTGGTDKTVWVGGMLARLDKAITFNNCKVSTDITYSGTATGEIGGFAGYGNANSTFNNCTFDGSIKVADTTSAAKVGGYIANSNGKTFTFNNSSSEGKIIANPAGGYHIGGFVAYTWGTEIFDGCYYNGSIEHSGSTKAIGGFVGWHATGSGKIEIKNSVSAGSIDVTGTSDGVGGFVGIIEKVLYEYPITITDSTASTEITVSGEGKVKNVGGFLGYFTYDSAEGKEASRGAKLTVKDSEFVGTIAIVDNAEVTEVAGIVGKIEMAGKQIEKLDENGDVVLDDKNKPVMVEKTDEILVIIDGCYTDGTITVSSKANDIAGYIAWSSSFVEIKNSTNSIDITMAGTVRDSWLCLAGFVGRKGSRTLTVTGCTNEGNITQNYDDGKFEKYILVGGVLSVSNGGKVDINATVNSGDIEINAFCADISGIGGILGWSNTNVAIDSVISYGDVVHNGDAAGVGGIAGYVSDKSVLTITNCMTLATEGAKGVDVTHINNRDTAVGGIVGYCGTADSTISNCYNELPVTLTIGEGAITNQRLGGIVGRAHAAKLVITECVNAGALNYAGVTSGIVGQHTSGDLSVVRCVNLGDLSEGTGKDPILNSAENVVCKDNVYLIDNFDGYSVYGTALSVGRELDAAINATKVIASYGFDELADAIDDADKFFASVDDRFIYAEFSWNKLNNAYNYAVAVNEKVGTTAIVIDENGDAKLNLLTQAEVNNAYYGLVDALDSMFKDGEMVALLEGAIAEAEKFMNANADTAFMPEAWTVFANVLAEAKTVAADDNISTAVDPAYMQKLATDLENAMKILVENKGGYIFTGDEFSKMNGQDGIFYLMADVKVTDTVNGFSGILNGNGYTVTVEKNSLFDNFSGTVSDITVAGDADGAAAVFGTASGDAEISNIIVTVKSFTAEVLFAGAAKDTKVVATNVLAAGEAKALAANGVTLKNAYLTGVEYYSVAGVKKTDGEIAKGLAAYNINKAFGENLLVQVIGKDTYPVMGAPAADGSNVVKLTDDGKLENPVKFFITDGEEPKFEEVPEIKPVTEMLENAIGRAEALKEADYEAASWTAFKAILASAKATLANANATQDALDNATSAVNIAIASLKAKVEAVVKVETDYSKLDAAIAAAKALKEADYTVESWTVLKMMLEAAEAAKTSDQQVMVNSAVAALENATLRLKTVKVEEKPEANKPEAPATTDETGCGSVVTGSAIAIAAVLALGAGVAFKKKED